MSRDVEYWVETADYDAETARAMLQTGRFLYVGFMCHLVIEKMLKACCASISGEMPPKVHNLRKLAATARIYDKMSDSQKDLLDKLEPLNVEARYPAYKDAVAASLSESTCASLLRETEELQLWIKQQLATT